MTAVLIPIFFHTDQTARLDDLRMDYSVGDAVVRGLRFYNVAAVGAYRDEADGKAVWFGRVYANGSEFISPLSQEHLEEIFDGCETQPNRRLREEWLKKSDYKSV